MGGPDVLKVWKEWIAAFDRACATDDWSSLSAFLTEDAVYIVAGAPFACEIRGREAVVAGFRRSIHGFDRKFDTRTWEGVGIKVWGETAITARAKGSYRLGSKPPISFSAHGSWYFRDGRISLMTDIYDVSEADVIATLQWLGEHGAGMDASYV
jgi:ketosteroid isomerase-like protein